MDSDLRIVIAGAGIGGLSAALSLHAAGFTNVVVVEAVPSIQPIGVGLNILPNAVRELTGLGVFDAVSRRAVKTLDFSLYHRCGSLIWREPRGVAAGHRWPQLSVHRGHLQQTLAAAVVHRLGQDSLVTDARVVGFEPRGADRVKVALQHPAAGGSSVHEADVLIGADGLHSTVRAALYPAEGEPCGNGLVMWRGTTWAEPYLSGRSMIVIGDDQQKIVVYPIVPPASSGSPSLINWVTGLPSTALPPGGTNSAERRAHVLRHYSSWAQPWLDIPALISEAVDILEYPMLDRDPLPRWAFGHVVLLGDAAHPMYPVGSNGATQAIVDGRAVAYYLATLDDPGEALAAFEADRRPKMTGVQAANRRMGPEQAIDLVHRRAPGGFTAVEDVISIDELREISRRYAQTGGFTPAQLNAEPTSPYAVGQPLQDSFPQPAESW
ncbi:flavin-dependent oxidoreductase [Streptomyces gardneri]|uniref:flavin-dependent oxidoreductase n=1 Tax=Nocardia sputi TaxID=2943705 RepID=UPI0018963101|nr:flavin-dependent oxidoreductase [Nocardia sputi]MBF6169661.1 flavin-dependent oxidoreductase [Streptomyces gardneri]MBF6204342.1 flavin-dependent oxidoreductase [Streptomyces gardneri]